MNLPDRATIKTALQAGLAGWRTPPGLALVAANLLPVFCVLLFDWSAQPLLAVYWLELVVIGVLGFLKAFFASPASIVGWFVKIITLPFSLMLLLPYLMLILLFGVLVFGMTPDQPTQHAFVSFIFFWAPGALPPDAAFLVLWRGFDLPTQVSAAVLAVSHLFSFFWHLLGRGEPEEKTFRKQVLQPFARVWLMLLAVMGAMFFIEANGVEPPRSVLLIIIAVKTYLDLRAHLAEHRPEARAEHNVETLKVPLH